MNDNTLKELWQAYDQKLERSYSIHLQSFTAVQTLKSKLALDRLRRLAVFELIVGLAVIFCLGRFLYLNLASPSLVVSAATVLTFTVIAVIGCVHQLELISRFDMAQDVTAGQAQLASLQAYTIKYLRLSILQVPFFLAYILLGFKIFLGFDLWAYGDRAYLISQLIFGGLLVPVTVWLYRKLSVRNMHVPWVRSVIRSMSGYAVFQAMEFLAEIERFRSE